MQSFANWRGKIFTTLVIAVLAGCAPEARRLANSIPHPGPAGYQRAQAIHHDPYLMDDVGPEVVGARPREYQRPLNEVERARLDTIPPPGVAVPAAPVGASPTIAPAYPGAPAPAPIVTSPAPASAPPLQYQQRPRY